MISNETINSLVIGNCIARSELNYNFFGGVSADCAAHLGEEEDIVGISEKLEVSFSFRVIDNSEDLRACIFQFDLPKIDGVHVEVDIKSFRVALEREGHLVSILAD